MKEKVCFKCNILKPLSDFYKHSKMGDGHLNKCKECTKKDVHKHREDNIDKVREYDRNRPNKKLRSIRQSIKNAFITEALPKYVDSTTTYRERNPIRYKAQSLVGSALKSGTLIKPTRCVKCGSTGKIEGHHNHYEKPLDVTCVVLNATTIFITKCFNWKKSITRKQEKFYKTTQNLYERLLNGFGNNYHFNLM